MAMLGTKISGVPGSSGEYEQWIKSGRVWDPATLSWYEKPTSTQSPSSQTNEQQLVSIQTQVNTLQDVINDANAAGITTGEIPSSITDKYDLSFIDTSLENKDVPMGDLDMPDELKDDPYFAQLDPESQALIAYYYNISSKQDTDRVNAFKDALDAAEAEADPYWREQISIVKDELTRTMQGYEMDLSTQEKSLQNKISRINEDLTYNKSFLTTEQQAELSRQKKQYEYDLQDTRDTMASRGLTFSSIRNQAEERLGESYEDTVGSATRKYDYNIRNIEVESTRNISDIGDQIANLKETTARAETSAVRKTEGYLGSSNLTDYSKYLLGGITGSMTGEKASDVLTRAQSLYLTKYPNLS